MRGLPQLKVIELLRTLDDVRQDWDSGSSGGGVKLMPSNYSLFSYQELERALCQMRETHRTQWWHISMRYRWGDPDHWQKVPSRKTRQGRVPILPERSELRIQGETVEQGLMWVKLYVWSPRVEATFVTQGIDTLTSMMYGGDTSRLALPEPFLERLLGVNDDEPQPRQGRLPSHSFIAA